MLINVASMRICGMGDYKWGMIGLDWVGLGWVGLGWVGLLTQVTGTPELVESD
ncbi:hypothetical protein LJR153_004560 [Paenibacillus sp. LjRoot153]